MVVDTFARATLLENDSTSLQALTSHYKAIKKAFRCVERMSRRLEFLSGAFEEKAMPAVRELGINTLPNEIMKMIFELAVADSEEARAASKAAVSLSHVSQKWRELALDTPRLWSKIELWGSPSRARAFLERSKAVLVDISLTINFDYHTTADDEPRRKRLRKELPQVFAAAVAHSKRWRSLTWPSEDFNDEEQTIPRLAMDSVETPFLEEMTLSGTFDIFLALSPPFHRLNMRSLHAADVDYLDPGEFDMVTHSTFYIHHSTYRLIFP